DHPSSEEIPAVCCSDDGLLISVLHSLNLSPVRNPKSNKENSQAGRDKQTVRVYCRSGLTPQVHVSTPSASPMSSIFSDIPAAPADPILGLTELFKKDPSPGKINLG